ncbi:MAG: metal ABC transporter ATP-binding protein [Peptostreptococcaceae bacterium]|nr:metal ABC transporter ATP-binding protein [Peptostreptococcaceae bacterium]
MVNDKLQNYAVIIEHLNVNYDNKKGALLDVNMKIAKGEYVAIIGPNGGGKTTLVKAMLGLIRNYDGKIKINGSISYVPQLNTVDRKFPVDVRNLILTGTYKGALKPFFKYSDEDYKITDKTINDLGINNIANKRISELSGGEYQKVLIARGIASGADILLLDEPTANIDSESRKNIYQILSELKGKYTIIITTHDTMAVNEHADSIACVNEKLIYHGKPEINQKIVDEMYGCNVDLLAHGVAHRVLRQHDNVGDAND